jgi:S-methylmethionine-dependent homocysteine/selenocysteine methylase
LAFHREPVTVQPPILSRLATGRPLLVSADPEASFRARGVALKAPASVGRLLREQPTEAAEHYHQEIMAGVDVLCALTAETIPRALGQIGMPFRAAALTGSAVELALEAVENAPRPIAVAGVLGSSQVGPTAPDRMTEDLAMHATRLAAAGCELLLARGYGQPSLEPGLSRIARRAAVVSAAATQLPTWAVIELSESGATSDGEMIEDAAHAAADAGAQVVLMEVPNLACASALLERARRAVPDVAIGVALGVSAGPLDLTGVIVHDPAAEIDAWAQGAKRLIDAGARVIGGGPGTTARHLAALSALLRGGERQSFWPRAG